MNHRESRLIPFIDLMGRAPQRAARALPSGPSEDVPQLHSLIDKQSGRPLDQSPRTESNLPAA